MSTYIVPNTGDYAQLTELTSRVRLPFVIAENARDFIALEAQHDHSIIGVSASTMLTLTRNASELLSEVPSVLVSVPGAVYTADWMMLASSMVTMDWLEFEKKLSKSGHTVTNVEQMDRASSQRDTPEGWKLPSLSSETSVAVPSKRISSRPRRPGSEYGVDAPTDVMEPEDDGLDP